MIHSTWSVSGLCVITRPKNLTSVEEILSGMSGIEVHATDPATGRLVVVQEGATVEDHQDGVRKIQAVPGVLTADLVMHYEDPNSISQSTAAGGA